MPSKVPIEPPYRSLDDASVSSKRNSQTPGSKTPGRLQFLRRRFLRFRRGGRCDGQAVDIQAIAQNVDHRHIAGLIKGV